MKKILSFILPVLIIFLGTACHRENPDPLKNIVTVKLTDVQKNLVVSNNTFGLNLFSQISSDDGIKNNNFISPLSVSLALAMTFNGANGDTKTEIQNTLGFSGFSNEEINGYFQKLSSTLVKLDPTVNLNLANSIWYRKDFSVLPDFLATNQAYYQAEISALDFSSPSSVNTINNWVLQATSGNIPKVIDHIEAYQVMFLINAIYFKGQWSYQFKKNQTAPDYFNNLDGSRTSVPFMHQSKSPLKYYSNDSLQILEMSYGQGNFAMDILLPAAGKTIAELSDGLNTQSWNDLMDKLFKTEVDVIFPKFSFTFSRMLNDDLAALGMPKAFSKSEADFTGINPQGNLYIDYVKHDSRVEVNEEGTVAAAATTVAVGKTSAGPPLTFRADHPFVFAIRETTTGTILFIGNISVL